MVEALIEIFKKDDELCYTFMEQCLKEDGGNYLMELLLECPDTVARTNVAILMKYVLNRLKVLEKDRLYETQSEEMKNEKGEIEVFYKNVTLTGQFMTKIFSILNT